MIFDVVGLKFCVSSELLVAMIHILVVARGKGVTIQHNIIVHYSVKTTLQKVNFFI